MIHVRPIDCDAVLILRDPQTFGSSVGSGLMGVRTHAGALSHPPMGDTATLKRTKVVSLLCHSRVPSSAVHVCGRSSMNLDEGHTTCTNNLEAGVT